MLILFCDGILSFIEPSPQWNAESALKDNASLFSTSQRNVLEGLLEKLWNQYKSPSYIITDYAENPQLKQQIISSFRRKSSKPKFF